MRVDLTAAKIIKALKEKRAKNVSPFLYILL